MFLTSFAVHVSAGNETVVVLRIHAVPAAFGGGGSYHSTIVAQYHPHDARPNGKVICVNLIYYAITLWRSWTCVEWGARRNTKPLPVVPGTAQKDDVFHGTNEHPPILLLDAIWHRGGPDDCSNHREKGAGAQGGARDVPLGHRERRGTFNPPLAPGFRSTGGDIQSYQFCP